MIINIKEYQKYIKLVKNAGSVFLGPLSAECFGDYASGTNHVLPTNGAAKAYSGLGVESFMKAVTFQEISDLGVLSLSKTVMELADFEGLDAHKKSIQLRVDLINSNSNSERQ